MSSFALKTIAGATLLAATAAHGQTPAEIQVGDDLSRALRAFPGKPIELSERPGALFLYGAAHSSAVVCNGKVIEISKNRGNSYDHFVKAVKYQDEISGPGRYFAINSEKSSGIIFMWASPTRELALKFIKITIDGKSREQFISTNSLLPTPCPWARE